MKIQLWTAHYEPQRSGIAPLMGVMARALMEQGIDVTVVAAHPFYPDAKHWPRRRLPTRSVENGVPVIRLPIYTGRGGVGQRVLQESSHAAALIAALPFLGRPDAVLAVSPVFLDLVPAMMFAKARRIPWVMWVQDILPDGATATGMVDEGRAVRAARRLENAAYRSAAGIVVIADSFVENLTSKGVDPSKIVRLYNPATVEESIYEKPIPTGDGVTIATMGNVGFSQNLRSVVETFEADEALAGRGARLVIAGDGAAADEVRGAIRSDRVRLTGFLNWDELEAELEPASVALVSQKYVEEAQDFNVPSKLMNFMARGMPVIAVVRPGSEVARIVRAADCGWIVDADSPQDLGPTALSALDDAGERLERGRRGREFAAANFRPTVLAASLEQTLADVVARAGS